MKIKYLQVSYNNAWFIGAYCFHDLVKSHDYLTMCKV